MLFQQTFKLSAVLFCACRQVAAHKYCVLSYYLNIVPADCKILLSSEKPEKAVSALDNYAADFRCAGIKFNIVCVA